MQAFRLHGMDPSTGNLNLNIRLCLPYTARLVTLDTDYRIEIKSLVKAIGSIPEKESPIITIHPVSHEADYKLFPDMPSKTFGADTISKIIYPENVQKKKLFLLSKHIINSLL